jgi:hypothetical protein
MAASNEGPHFEIPKTCKAGVCVNEGFTVSPRYVEKDANLMPGPDFYVEIQDVPVPEPGTSTISTNMTNCTC